MPGQTHTVAVLRDAKWRELRTGDWVQSLQYPGWAGEVLGLCSQDTCQVYWWGHAVTEIADVQSLIVVPRKEQW